MLLESTRGKYLLAIRRTADSIGQDGNYVPEPDRLKLIYLHFWDLHCHNIASIVWFIVNLSYCLRPIASLEAPWSEAY